MNFDLIRILVIIGEITSVFIALISNCINFWDMSSSDNCFLPLVILGKKYQNILGKILYFFFIVKVFSICLLLVGSYTIDSYVKNAMTRHNYDIYVFMFVIKCMYLLFLPNFRINRTCVEFLFNRQLCNYKIKNFQGLRKCFYFFCARRYFSLSVCSVMITIHY
jgi:hypothetical protein